MQNTLQVLNFLISQDNFATEGQKNCETTFHPNLCAYWTLISRDSVALKYLQMARNMENGLPYKAYEILHLPGRQKMITLTTITGTKVSTDCNLGPQSQTPNIKQSINKSHLTKFFLKSSECTVHEYMSVFTSNQS